MHERRFMSLPLPRLDGAMHCAYLPESVPHEATRHAVGRLPMNAWQRPQPEPSFPASQTLICRVSRPVDP